MTCSEEGTIPSPVRHSIFLRNSAILLLQCVSLLDYKRQVKVWEFLAHDVLIQEEGYNDIFALQLWEVLDSLFMQ